MNYVELQKQLQSLFDGQDSWFTNLSQFSAFINDSMPDINWVGFYLTQHGNHLKLGPFQGRVACVDIPFGKGVCGAAAATGEVQLVADVHQFEGHIACDARSNSEVVIPMIYQDRLLGVLDIDSPTLNRFTPEDAIGLQQLVKVLIDATNWPESFS